MTIVEYLAERQIKPSVWAAELGVPASTVSRWIRGIRQPTIGSLIMIERVTRGRLKVSDFFPEETE